MPRETAFAAQAKLPPDPLGDFYHGGTFCSAEYEGEWDPKTGERR